MSQGRWLDFCGGKELECQIFGFSGPVNEGKFLVPEITKTKGKKCFFFLMLDHLLKLFELGFVSIPSETKKYRDTERINRV